MPSPPSQELIRLVAKAPEELYYVQVNTGSIDDYQMPHDGRIKIAVPGYGGACRVYLFDWVKVRG